ncbi:hypothetical protein EUGRSUZ_J00983 [Eucalyptus grandis]|uniref:Uncharacterized protein n=2 Tax=Eucalyptus grandis TaxID=71139 RepID=A0ACC3J3N5_EUCGR|nr:hypothetical protein EUGRSUZ_J00983 [Eucalyptus grandis]
MMRHKLIRRKPRENLNLCQMNHGLSQNSEASGFQLVANSKISKQVCPPAVTKQIIPHTFTQLANPILCA